MFPIETKDGSLLYPSDLALLYDGVHDLALVAKERGVCPVDILQGWSNVLGFLRRVPGQPYHRPACNGRDDTPTKQEFLAAYSTLRLYGKRLRRVLAHTSE